MDRGLGRIGEDQAVDGVVSPVLRFYSCLARGRCVLARSIRGGARWSQRSPNGPAEKFSASYV